jgi:hypothetical protein
MLCCLVGGLLVGALARAARRRRAHNPLLALAFGFGVGALVVELVITALVPLGSVSAPGSLGARLGLLIVPAVLAVGAGLAGAGGSLFTRVGVITVAAAAAGGAVIAEDLDLHVLHLHSDVGVVAAVTIHAPAFVLLAAGLRWRAKLPASPADASPCGCDIEPRTPAPRRP